MLQNDGGVFGIFMKKPEQLKLYLLHAIAELQQNPDRLLIFVDDGKIRHTHAQGLSFEYHYTLTLVLTDYAGDLAGITIPLLDWLKVNQSELFANLSKVEEGLPFEAEILSNHTVDLVIKLPLTERVIVKKHNTQLHVDYPSEPQYSQTEPSQPVILYDKDGSILAQWQSQENALYHSLDMPLPKRPTSADTL